LNHRNLTKVDYSRHISFEKINFYKTRALVAGTSVAGRQKRQVGWVIDKPYIAANIFAAATNRTNKRDRPGLLSVYPKKISMNGADSSIHLCRRITVLRLIYTSDFKPRFQNKLAHFREYIFLFL
jgi:hypothetical protein